VVHLYEAAMAAIHRVNDRYHIQMLHPVKNRSEDDGRLGIFRLVSDLARDFFGLAADAVKRAEWRKLVGEQVDID